MQVGQEQVLDVRGVQCIDAEPLGGLRGALDDAGTHVEEIGFTVMDDCNACAGALTVGHRSTRAEHDDLSVCQGGVGKGRQQSREGERQEGVVFSLGQESLFIV
ncbi:hypothetical protein GCM10007159_39580 [Modicisalibacter luteus]|nr:hypothetical protein GCM10007159_39580 [Halomonas lutea]